MAFVTPTDVTVGSVLTASKYNQEVVENTLDLRARDGLVFITTVALSGSSTNVNNVFSTDYDNYRMIGYATIASGTPQIRFRLRVSASDASGTDYAFQEVFGANTSLGGARATGQTFARVGQLFTSGNTHFSCDIYNPFLASPTAYFSCTMDPLDGIRLQNFAGRHGLSTSYTGLTMFPESSTFTGSVSVYGYAK
jgi:hypothetical protein